jgi:hypothetical protein
VLVLAHGIATREALPIPFWLAQWGAALVLLASFALLGVVWRSARFESAGGRPAPGWVQALADSPVTFAVLRALGILAAVVTLVAAIAGPATAVTNPAPTWLYVWLWVGIVPLSLLLGPVWRWLNPLRTIAAGLARLSGDPDERAARPYPPRLGYWPAAIGLAAFAWLELIYERRAEPQAVLIFLCLYGLAQLGGAMRFGSAWFARADGFEVWSELLGRMAPLGRLDGSRAQADDSVPVREGSVDGPVVWRGPLAGLAGVRPEPGLVAVLSILLGATAFDGISSSSWWGDLAAGRGELGAMALGTAGLAVVTGLVAGSYLLAARASAALAGRPAAQPVGAGAPVPPVEDRAPAGAEVAGWFAHSLVPIAAGYTIAHYFSLLVWQGQAGYILASDPLGRGWDLFGTISWQIQLDTIPPTTIAVVQVAAIVLGHLFGVVAAHDRAVAVFGAERARRSQYPLIAVMVAFTLAGIALLLR